MRGFLKRIAVTCSVSAFVLPSLSLSCGKSGAVNNSWKKILPAVQLVKANVPNELMPGVNKNEKLYDELKSKQCELTVTYNGDNVSFSNDWISFIASNKQVNEGFGGVDNFKKTFADAISRTIVTDFWKNHPGSISLFGDNIPGARLGSGALERNGHSNFLYYFAKQKFTSVNDFLLFMKLVFVHEWGLIEVGWFHALLMDGNGVESLSDEDGIESDAVKCFLDNIKIQDDIFMNLNNLNVSQLILRYNKSANNYKLFSSGILPWTGYDQKKNGVFNSLENYPGNNTSMNAWVGSGDSVAGYLDEITTRLCGTYTMPFDSYFKSAFQNKPSWPFQDTTEASALFDYDFFNPNDDSQSLNIMRAVLKGFYRFGQKATLSFSFDSLKKDVNGMMPIQDFHFYSVAQPETLSFSKVRITNEITKKSLEIPIQHSQFPVGFNRNPFTPYEYKYVADSAFGVATQPSKDTFDKDHTKVELIDLDNHVVSSDIYTKFIDHAKVTD